MHRRYMHPGGYMHHGYMQGMSCIMDTGIMDTTIRITDTYITDTCITDTCIMDTSAWIRRPERPKNAKDEVKQGPKLAQTKGRKLEVGPRRGPRLLVINNRRVVKFIAK